MEQHENELTGSYALNALNETERRELLEHAERSSAVRDEIDALAETAGLLGLTAEPVAPPARVKSNIMSAIRTTTQLPAQETSTQNLPVEAPAAESPRRESTAPVTDLATEREARRPGRASVRVLGIAAGVLLVSSAGLTGVVINQNAQQQKLEQELSAVADRQAELTRILTASDVKSATKTLEDGARVTLAYSAGEGMMAVTTAGLPELPQDKGYELWLISDSDAVSAGMVDGASPGTMTMVTGSMKGVTHFGITVEPAGGSPTPTTTPILYQEL